MTNKFDIERINKFDIERIAQYQIYWSQMLTRFIDRTDMFFQLGSKHLKLKFPPNLNFVVEIRPIGSLLPPLF